MAPPVDSWMDSDRDGVADIREVLAGTDPKDRDSVFRMRSVALAAGTITLEWESVARRSYLIQWTEAIGMPWRSLKSVVATSEMTRELVPLSEAGAGGFYRVAIVQ